ncbi:MAG: peptidase M10 [Bacteroidetes bacterium]|nr:peptidase M10 [Bacteroidota bacterium]
MCEAELILGENVVLLQAHIYLYGKAANAGLAILVAKNIEDYWNAPQGRASIGKNLFSVRFQMQGFFFPDITPSIIYQNTEVRNNYFRVEEFATGNISFVDGLGSNTGYFKLENLLNNSTTAAHEFGHTLGLDHPHDMDIRGQGAPSIMYPRGTLVDAQYQYDPAVPAGAVGGTMNPFHRIVTQADIDDLKLSKLDFDKNNVAKVGDFSSIWHEPQVLKK